uniref:CSN8/PSMD8/EIF3K domain-containing protein n=1 Tax=Chromera velia CCMP2878 TaxID=1169474 RepID=A0A0G4F451_9ALVE|eukprot:Cvel_15107.t1-p1 / transcript=Cvel_15107.t1 / gene=Cvel_15107 / organism=Chromera_velia_CCMP2878 / gene_product=26S proteasome non-ATPase regulatory subunit 8, putative / transcript_product=26S proteasome non-ATPase regulatory subunit 8, putative / location=Cvel_scaffold1102:43786-47581(-) / protein_length=322 / sequence_SO=supercontig / SO=protein_coding / is_pseudo=false
MAQTSKEHVQAAAEKLKKFQQMCNQEPADVPKCMALLNELKVDIAGFSTSSLIPPSAGAVKDKGLYEKELLIARETLEIGAFLAVRKQDSALFERHVLQLKTYYRDFGKQMPPSQRQYPIMGMFLLHMLAENRIGDFHTELELIPQEERGEGGNTYLKHPIALERALMEGNYNKVLTISKDVPLPIFRFFVDTLTTTIRKKIAESLETAYSWVDVPFACRMLSTGSEAELRQLAKEMNARGKREAGEGGDVEMDGGAAAAAAAADAGEDAEEEDEEGIERKTWEVEGNKLYFKSAEGKKTDLEALTVITNTMAYASELERIV